MPDAAHELGGSVERCRVPQQLAVADGAVGLDDRVADAQAPAAAELDRDGVDGLVGHGRGCQIGADRFGPGVARQMGWHGRVRAQAGLSDGGGVGWTWRGMSDGVAWRVGWVGTRSVGSDRIVGEGWAGYGSACREARVWDGSSDGAAQVGLRPEWRVGWGGVLDWCGSSCGLGQARQGSSDRFGSAGFGSSDRLGEG